MGWALNVVLEFVAAAFSSESELAATDLGLGSPRGDPRVATGAEHAGGNGWGVGFGEVYGEVYGFFELVVED